MAMEISMISVGAVFLIVLLFMALICTSRDRDKCVQGDGRGKKSTGNDLFVVFMLKVKYTDC